MGLAMASNTSGGTGVGPGASRYRLSIDDSSWNGNAGIAALGRADDNTALRRLSRQRLTLTIGNFDVLQNPPAT
jgi:hypothetical protein